MGEEDSSVATRNYFWMGQNSVWEGGVIHRTIIVLLASVLPQKIRKEGGDVWGVRADSEVVNGLIEPQLKRLKTVKTVKGSF